MTWVSNTMPRPPAKRAAALALINAAAHVSSIYTSFLFPASASPRYIGAFVHNSLLATTAIAAAWMLRLVLLRLNRKLDRGETIQAAPGEAVEHGFRFLV